MQDLSISFRCLLAALSSSLSFPDEPLAAWASDALPINLASPSLLYPACEALRSCPRNFPTHPFPESSSAA